MSPSSYLPPSQTRGAQSTNTLCCCNCQKRSSLYHLSLSRTLLLKAQRVTRSRPVLPVAGSMLQKHRRFGPEGKANGLFIMTVIKKKKKLKKRENKIQGYIFWIPVSSSDLWVQENKRGSWIAKMSQSNFKISRFCHICWRVTTNSPLPICFLLGGTKAS